ncbi:uncharacterized protein LOC130613062 [Hydractinia symbiolongicarpus]|uniref:uncharacterized protein LOC130613062 n=1 Tax=Hydractinia symbiolongicarpus TaxID=13093 RepID=UPI00254E88A0|nr:uncharacterized protein LOC130613062 [Hydractinia symbiolongicarpus]
METKGAPTTALAKIFTNYLNEDSICEDGNLWMKITHHNNQLYWNKIVWNTGPDFHSNGPNTENRSKPTKKRIKDDVKLDCKEEKGIMVYIGNVKGWRESVREKIKILIKLCKLFLKSMESIFENLLNMHVPKPIQYRIKHLFLVVRYEVGELTWRDLLIFGVMLLMTCSNKNAQIQCTEIADDIVGDVDRISLGLYAANERQNDQLKHIRDKYTQKTRRSSNLKYTQLDKVTSVTKQALKLSKMRKPPIMIVPNYQFNLPNFAPPNVNRNDMFGGFNNHCKNTAGNAQPNSC